MITVEHLEKNFRLPPKGTSLRDYARRLFVREQAEYFTAVQNISFTIEQGEFIGFLGPNGAGKTTTLKMLSGILTPSSGHASVLGYTPWERHVSYKKQIAMVMGQKSQLWWDLPPKETFLLNKDMYGISDSDFQQHLYHLGEVLEIDPDIPTPVRSLSLGQRMKCELIASLLHRPRVLFLDEPTIGLDVVSQKQLRTFLKKYNQETGATIMLTSHYMADVQELCKRILIIDHGKKIYDGTMDYLFEHYSKEKEVLITFAKLPTPEQLESLGTIHSQNGVQVSFLIPRSGVSHFIKIVLHDYVIDDLSIRELEATDIIADIFSSSIPLS